VTAVSDVVPASTYTPDTTAPLTPAAPEARWHPATRFAFRVTFLHFALYIMFTQMLPTLLAIPGVNMPDLGETAPVRAIVMWVATHILGLTYQFSAASTGSGDKTYDWVQAFTMLVTAVVAGSVWTIVARERLSHERLFAWFRLFVRLGLGTTFLLYGFIKVFPLQMSAPSLGRLLEPFGDFSPMGVLWSSIGASQPYEMVVGGAEVLGGVLVMIPQTTKLGALLCLVDAADVFALNMSYDVPVKLFSFHLILMSLALIAPDARRYINLFVLGRTARLRPEPSVAKTLGGQRAVLVAQLVFLIYAVGNNAWGNAKSWTEVNSPAFKSPLYGIWEVREMTVGGVTLPPLLTDTTRWRRVLFQTSRGMSLRKMNDSAVVYRTTVDTVARTIVLSSFADSTKPKQTLTYNRPERTRLVLDGTLDGKPIHVDMAFRDPDSFLLRSRKFSWVQERPFNR
jgi:uncharacterized membrane protein YphA (DoxX/SURF4 family)